MIENPYFVTSDKMSELLKDIKLHNGYCAECQKPLYRKRLYCSRCLYELHHNGFSKRVRISEAGKRTINYQQHLHRKFFKCNSPVKYRGEINQRIKNHIKQETIEKAVNKLHILLSEPKYTYQNRLRTKPKELIELYNYISDIRNILKRLLYNTLLFYIDYNILNSNEYKSLANFQASVVNNLYINMENTKIRTTNKETTRIFTMKKRIKGNDYRLYPYIYEELTKIVTPLISELYK